MRDLRIVFMGTPDFAVTTLDALVKNNYNVVGVVTVADKPAGRGRKLMPSAVKRYAQEHQLKILQPTNLKDNVFLDELRGLNADLQVVVAFRMLPEVVWKMPSLGTFNLHASLLPDYRGAAPIHWAIINGEKETGVTTFFIDDKIDTGAILLQESAAISSDETVGELHDRLMNIGSNLVLKTVDLINKGDFKTINQSENSKKKAPKIFPETCKIDWNEHLDTIYNKIRGLNPYPTAWTYLNNNSENIKVKLFAVIKYAEDHTLDSGCILSGKKELRVAVKGGFIQIQSLQIAGKKRMSSESLLNGFSFSPDSKFY